MSHQRQLIRTATVAALLNKTSAGTRVFPTRRIKLKGLELPAVCVYTDDEASQTNSSAPRELDRTIQLAIEALVSAAGNVDDVMDAIAHQIEVAMHADWTLGATASDSWLASTTMLLDESGASPIGMVRLVYSCRYFTYAPDAADVTLDTFSTAGIKYSLNSEQVTADQSADEVDDLEV